MGKELFEGVQAVRDAGGPETHGGQALDKRLRYGQGWLDLVARSGSVALARDGVFQGEGCDQAPGDGSHIGKRQIVGVRAVAVVEAAG